MKLIVSTNDSFIAEKEYILNYILSMRLGLDYVLKIVETGIESFQICNQNGESIFISDTFFKSNENSWLTKNSLPSSPVKYIPVCDDVLALLLGYQTLPVVYGNNSECVIEGRKINIDIFGSAFYLLSGYEELVINEVNMFGNFPFEKSFLSQDLLIRQPIVDDYVLILAYYLQKLLGVKEMKKNEFRFSPTHDIDRAFKFHELTLFEHIKGSLGDIVKRKSIKQLLVRNQSYWLQGKNDPYNTYYWLMEQSELRSLKSIFYFKNCNRFGEKDSAYNIRTKALSRQIKDIDKRGHCLGFHPSYETYLNKKLMRSEADDFRQHLRSIGVGQEIKKVRQHYLRYRNPETSELHVEVGFTDDSTLGFSNKAGFRRGTCHPFPVFNIILRRETGIVEHPLILMDVTLFLEAKSPEDRYNLAKQLITTCKHHKGEFVLLWHNEALQTKEDKDFYSDLLTLA
ncbi:MAG TPA: polysaccharide deacetylase family protein [Salinivirgaceae bacterium]|nr:polysaccharide deacetylase family protein [Salinivirgaceae bacterium]